MENERDFIALSYISQYGYCPRRAALIMNHQIWQENEFTAEGRVEHERVHTARIERRGDFLKLYDFSVFSEKLMIAGKCDCIEAIKNSRGAYLPEEQERFQLYPIEYKHGKVRNESEYMQQLCAQAICLEEMYDVSIAEGALFFINEHRRLEVQFTNELREKTIKTCSMLWECFQNKTLPRAKWSAKCKKCSLCEDCLPKVQSSARDYCEKALHELKEGKE